MGDTQGQIVFILASKGPAKASKGHLLEHLFEFCVTLRFPQKDPWRQSQAPSHTCQSRRVISPLRQMHHRLKKGNGE